MTHSTAVFFLGLDLTGVTVTPGRFFMLVGVPIFPWKLSGVLGFLLIAMGEAFALMASGVEIFNPYTLSSG